MATHWTYATGLVWFGRFYGRVVTRQNAILAVLTGKGPHESQITTKSDLEWPYVRGVGHNYVRWTHI